MLAIILFSNKVHATLIRARMEANAYRRATATVAYVDRRTQVHHAAVE